MDFVTEQDTRDRPGPPLYCTLKPGSHCGRETPSPAPLSTLKIVAAHHIFCEPPQKVDRKYQIRTLNLRYLAAQAMRRPVVLPRGLSQLGAFK